MLFWENSEPSLDWLGPGELAHGPSKPRTWGSRKCSCEQHKCSHKVQSVSRDKPHSRATGT